MNAPALRRTILAHSPRHRRAPTLRALAPTALLLTVAVLGAATARAADWPGWRGPHHNGSGDAHDLPTSWSETTNLRWLVEMPGQSAATPAVLGDRVFAASNDQASTAILAMCFDRATGQELWRRPATPMRTNPRNTAASASPVADAERVWFIFGTGDLVCYSHEGRELWRRNLEDKFGPLSLQFLYSSSPLLYRDRLYLAVLRNVKQYHGETDGLESFLLCVDPATGQDLWVHVRPTQAQGESAESYVTPIPCELGERPRILLMGGDYLTAHDATVGLEVWRLAYNPDQRLMWRVIPSPVIAGDLIVANLPRGRTACFAVPGDLKGNSTWADCEWLHQDLTPDVCTPLYYDGRLYLLDGVRRRLACLDPATGDAAWTHEFDSRAIFRASPTGADGKIYCINMDGEVFVLRAGPTPELLGRASLGGDPAMASIVAVDDSLIVRTADRLWCAALEDTGAPAPHTPAADALTSNTAPASDAPSTITRSTQTPTPKEPS